MKVDSARLSLIFSVSALVVAALALAYAVDPGPIKGAFARVASWSSPPPPPDPDVAAAETRMGRRKAAESARRKALAEALARDAAKAQPPQQRPGEGAAP